MPDRQDNPPARDPESEPQPSPADITRLLEDWRDGDAGAFDQLMPIVYNELRRLARKHLAAEHGERTLQATGLVHEAYLRLVDMDVGWSCREHFFAVASRQMRRILVDEARKKLRQKRGSERPLSLDQLAAEPIAQGGRSLLDLDLALQDLATFDERKVRVLEMRLFAGLTISETAEILDVSTATVERELALARAWLSRELAPS